VLLTPLGVGSLLGVPAGVLASRVVELHDLLGPRASELAPGVAWAWRRLATAHGAVSVDALAREIGWSRRHFSERFRAELGLSPKSAVRVLRFERARSLFGRARVRISDVAAASGYADQSHLTWVALSGCTPRAWLADELPFLQDYEVEELASSES